MFRHRNLAACLCTNAHGFKSIPALTCPFFSCALVQSTVCGLAIATGCGWSAGRRTVPDSQTTQIKAEEAAVGYVAHDMGSLQLDEMMAADDLYDGDDMQCMSLS